ncbi:MAG: hypothetical protein E4G91_04115 [Candidatus Zixiibacteriota bacterium]|nr:MAG: hypothetical protein E4G91_04115 [candidate division Zixibacteria bacterium]
MGSYQPYAGSANDLSSVLVFGRNLTIDGSQNDTLKFGLVISGQTATGSLSALKQAVQGGLAFICDRKLLPCMGNCGGCLCIDPDQDSVGSACDNCPLTSNQDQTDTNSDGVGDVCQTRAVVTPPDDSVQVTPTGDVIVSFDNISIAGMTEVITRSTGVPPPTGYMVSSQTSPIYYEIATGAIFSGPITVCLTYDPSQLTVPEDSVRMFHLSADPRVCGRVTSLSPFILAEPTLSVVCGDADGSSSVDISDAVYLIAYIFSGGSAPNPVLAGDANCDSAVDISDVVYLIAYIFSGGLAPCEACK